MNHFLNSHLFKFKILFWVPFLKKKIKLKKWTENTSRFYKMVWFYICELKTIGNIKYLESFYKSELFLKNWTNFRESNMVFYFALTTIILTVVLTLHNFRFNKNCIYLAGYLLPISLFVMANYYFFETYAFGDLL